MFSFKVVVVRSVYSVDDLDVAQHVMFIRARDCVRISEIYMIRSNVAVGLQRHQLEVVVVRSVNSVDDREVAQHILCNNIVCVLVISSECHHMLSR